MAIVTALAIAYYVKQRKQRAKADVNSLVDDHADGEAKLGPSTRDQVTKPSSYRSYINGAYSYISRRPNKELLSILILGLPGAGKTSLMNVLSCGDTINQHGFQKLLATKTPSALLEQISITASPITDPDIAERKSTDANSDSSEFRVPDFEIEEILHPRPFGDNFDGKKDGNSLRVFDLSGHSGVRVQWHAYFADADAMIYVVDSSARKNVKASGEEFVQLLKFYDERQSSEMKKKPNGGGGAGKNASQIILLLANKQDILGCLSNEELFRRMGLQSCTDLLKNRKWNIFGCSVVTGEGLADAMNWFSMEIAKSRGVVR
ncbi:hypothetical protein HK098_004045 [Nowakowskiella sp. JEL0407]|nr:hypothetical protein HK098_004045 [Nowakowskiella sp. JEL0407]